MPVAKIEDTATVVTARDDHDDTVTSDESAAKDADQYLASIFNELSRVSESIVNRLDHINSVIESTTLEMKALRKP